MGKYQQKFVFAYFILILFNVNTILCVWTDSVAIISKALIALGVISLIITLPLAAALCRADIIRSLFIFIGVFSFFGILVYFFSSDGAEEGLQHGLYMLGRSIIIIFPVGVLFFDKVRKKGLYAFLREILVLFFIACLSVPLFKEVGVSFEEIINHYSFVYTRYSGIWGNADVASSFINCTAVLVLYLRITKEIRPLYFYLCYAILGYCVLLTSSNTGALIFISSLLIYLYYSLVSGRVISVGLFIFILLVPLIYLNIIWLANYFAANEIGYIAIKSKNLLNILTLNFNDINYSGRNIMFDQGLDLVKRNWIAGYGIGYFARPIFAKMDVMHNYFLTMWGEAGIAGLLNVIVFLCYFIYKMLRTNVKILKFIYVATFVFYSLSFFSGAGLIGNFNTLIFYIIIATISFFGGRSEFIAIGVNNGKAVEGDRHDRNTS